MTLLCTGCGNYETFRRTNQGHEYYTETEFLNSDSDTTDYGDREPTESETDDWGVPECDACGLEVEDYGTDELYMIAWRSCRDDEPPVEPGDDPQKTVWKDMIKNITRA